MAWSVISLRGVINDEWLECCRAGIEASLATPGSFFRDQTPAGSPARYVFDYWNWPNVPEFRRLVLESPFGELIAGLLWAREVRLLMDNWFMREAGATNGAPWHHDEPYFDFVGDRKCVLWFPMETASRAEGLTFTAGSHRWGRLYRPQNSREHRAFDGVACKSLCVKPIFHIVRAVNAKTPSRILADARNAQDQSGC